MKNRMLPILAPTLLLLAAVFTGCNKDEVDGYRLPDGKHPLTLTATVEGLMATRATTNNTWDGTEKVAVIGVIDNATVQTYTADATGELTTTDPYYWQSTTETKALSAWVPYSAVKPTTFAVKADQSSSDAYQNSDMLWSSKEISYKNSALEFKHLSTKVVVNLTNGEGVTESEVTNATVTLVNQNLTSGTIANDWTVAQATTGSDEIKTNEPTTPASGFLKTVQALVTPQQMQNKQFIKITTGGAVARDYYYVPTENDAKLESGKQYTYAITVNKTGLVVSVGTSVKWEEGSLVATPDYRVMMPTVAGLTIAGLTKSTGGTYYEIDDKFASFTISYAVSDNEIKGFPVVQGLCDVKRTTSNGTYTFTYSNIRSDLKLANDIYGELGDFYCKDASGNAYIVPSDVVTLTATQKADCLGIVLKGGKDDSGEWKDDCIYTQKDGTTPMGFIHGYVLALYDSSGPCMWGTSGTKKVDHPDMNREQHTGFYGYKNTNAIKKFVLGMTLLEAFPATYYAAEHYEGSHPAPANSSGWFLPSGGQCKYWSNNKAVILASVKKATGNSSTWGNFYWSSSEYDASSEDSAWRQPFINGNYAAYGKKVYEHYVRGVLAF